MDIKKGTIIGLVLVFLITVSGFLFNAKTLEVHAEEVPIAVVETETDTGNVIFEETDDPMGVGLPTASTDEITQWTERKGFEIIGMLQKFVQPFAIVIFIGCAILTLVGAFGNSKMVSKGLMGMFTALIMYIVVLYAPEIMDIFLNFVKS